MANIVFLDDEEVGQRYGVHRSRVLPLVKQGVIPEPVKLSARCLRWPIADLEIWDEKYSNSKSRNEVEVCNHPNTALSGPIPTDFSWNEVYEHWKYHISANLPSLTSVITPMSLRDPGKPRGRHTDYAFWPAKKVDAILAQSQAYLDRCPGSDGIVHRPMPKECRVTAEYLGVARDSLSASCAVLMAASLRSRGKLESIFNYRNSHKTNQFKEVISKEVHRSLGSRFDGWASACTTVLPCILLGTRHKAETLDEVIQLLAQEHAMVLRKFRVVGVDYLPRS